MFTNFLRKFGFLSKNAREKVDIVIDRSYKFEKNFTPSQSRSVNHLVLHHVAANSFEEAVLTLKDCEVSSHYIIDELGKVFLLVEEKDIAYHAGVSFWGGQDGLNATSIGIEFYNPKPFELAFSKKQIAAGLRLCSKIVNQYQIRPQNVVGHSDIAYFVDNEENRNCGIVGFLGRKQDPGPLFPWQEFYDSGIAESFEPQIMRLLKEINIDKNETSSSLWVEQLKSGLKDFGYKIDHSDNTLDAQFLTVINSAKLRFGVNFVG